MSLAERITAAWYSGHPALSLLRPLEWLYRVVVQRKRARFLAGEGVIYRAPVPVVVVGNITVGGTGKTPLILWLIEHCRRQGLRVGVVSRGYGAQPPQLPWRVQADQAASVAGDEPLLIVQRSGVPLMIDPDRGRAVAALLAAEPLDLILSDDGLQHYRLARDLELVLIDAARGLGNRRCLPAGPLREPLERLHSVDALLYNGASEDPQGGYSFNLQPQTLINLRSGETRSLEHFPPGQALHAVAGIGNPQRFFNTLEGLHWRPVRHAFADHAPYSAELLNFSPALPLVMTEKDAVKCRAFAAPDWWYLTVDGQPSPAFVAWLDGQLQGLLPHRWHCADSASPSRPV
jgi:tetraacyldisaccharide 4'-kinase